MFVFSFNASKIKLFASILVCAAVVGTAVALMPDTEHSVTVNGTQYDKKISFDGIKNNEDIHNLAENLGYVLEDAPIESCEVKIPSKMDAVLTKYNEIQKSQGFNLAKYKKKNVMRYTYVVKALPDNQSLPEDDVLLTLILYKDKIIGGDLYFTGENGEVKAFLK